MTTTPCPKCVARPEAGTIYSLYHCAEDETCPKRAAVGHPNDIHLLTPAEHAELLAARDERDRLRIELASHTYTSKQATNCAECGKHKHTPLRIDAMGGYVCLTCIDKRLGGLLGEFGYPDATDWLTDEQIVEIRDDHLPSQGGTFDCIAFAKAVLVAVARKAEGSPA